MRDSNSGACFSAGGVTEIEYIIASSWHTNERVWNNVDTINTLYFNENK